MAPARSNCSPVPLFRLRCSISTGLIALESRALSASIMRPCSAVSVVLVEQKLDIALDISQRVYVMGHGSIVFEGTPADLKKDAATRKEWLEV